MIYYPIETLKSIGCTDIVIVSGGEHIGGFAELLKDGADLGVSITYRVQREADGVAGALLCAAGLVEGTFPVILGDNYFADPPAYNGEPAIYLSEVEDPERFGVFQGGRIVEKPEHPESKLVSVGFYVYDVEVFSYVRGLSPSQRGELEIADVNNWYLSRGCSPKLYESYWRDMGTFNTLMEVAEYERSKQTT